MGAILEPNGKEFIDSTIFLKCSIRRRDTFKTAIPRLTPQRMKGILSEAIFPIT